MPIFSLFLSSYSNFAGSKIAIYLNLEVERTLVIIIGKDTSDCINKSLLHLLLTHWKKKKMPTVSHNFKLSCKIKGFYWFKKHEHTKAYQGLLLFFSGVYFSHSSFISYFSHMYFHLWLRYSVLKLQNFIFSKENYIQITWSILEKWHFY